MISLPRQARTQATAARRVDGAVVHGTAKGPRPIAAVRVVLHRVGSDRAGPLDSALTDSRGQYHFRFTPSGSPDAIYFVSASYDGIAYFSVPLREPVTRGDDAMITVFDTTSGNVPLHVLGHHIILGSPDGQGAREVVEVYELGNDSSVTRVAGGVERPVWETTLPPNAENPRVNPSGEIPPNKISFTNGRVRLYAPVSPGARQLSYAYRLSKDALPLSIHVDQPTSVLEVLLEEPRGTVSGGGLSEVAPTTTAGRSFRRFLAQNVSAPTELRLDVPFTIGDMRSRYFFGVAAVCALGMLAAIVFASRRRRAVAISTAARNQIRPADDLLHAIAVLDARMEQGTILPDERARYDAERADLKSRLAAALAEEREPR